MGGGGISILANCILCYIVCTILPKNFTIVSLTESISFMSVLLNILQGVTDYCSPEDLAHILPDSHHPEYSDIKVRYRTYTNWNHQQDPKNLAQAGLFYTGINLI